MDDDLVPVAVLELDDVDDVDLVMVVDFESIADSDAERVDEGVRVPTVD